MKTKNYVLLFRDCLPDRLRFVQSGLTTTYLLGTNGYSLSTGSPAGDTSQRPCEGRVERKQ